MDFDQAYAAELEKLRAARQATASSDALIGLAFSGGGIRSATFNLGILQGLARRGLLKHIDYLSTVSGGGYIGAWYMALLRRLADGQPALAEALLNPDALGGATREAAAVLWLRRFSNYLSPKTGLSGDTLAMVATYLRNLLLNLTVFIAFLCSLLLLPYALAWGIPFIEYYGWLPWLATLPLAFAVSALLPLLYRLREAPGTTSGTSWWQGQIGILALVVLPALVGAFFLAVALASSGFAAWSTQLSATLRLHLPWLGAIGLDHGLLGMLTIATLIYLLPWLLGGVPLLVNNGTARAKASLALSALGASLLAGLLFYALALLAQSASPTPFEQAVFGLPLVLLACIMPVGLHIGLARRQFTELQREWWSRLGGWLLVLALAWLLVTAIALFGPTALYWLNDYVAASGGLAWLATTLWGIIAGKGADSGQAGKKSWRETLLRLAPWIFIVGLLCLLSLALQRGLAETAAPAIAEPAARWSAQIKLDLDGPAAQSYSLSGSASGTPAAEHHWRQQAAVAQAAVRPTAVWRAQLALLGVFLLFGWRIDINLFSLHNFYRNRLMRTYLGASRQASGNASRRPDPFTGFDPDDDLAVSALGPRPYPLFNTALNLVGGDELAWQQRKAASFCIAPGYCGYQFPAGFATAAQGYGPTRDFLSAAFPAGGGIRLSSAMAISGAAVNPNMGFHSSPAVSFLLTVFNVRLGRWVGNPADAAAWRQGSPAFGVGYLFLELFGLTSVRRAWFNLSDGGHFENLGIYELVRRRLPYIVAVDAAQDAGYLFDDLANAIRKVRTDFCIDIEIDVGAMRPRQHDGRQAAHVAIGSIRYDQIDAHLQPGVLVYIRPGLTGKEPADVQSYARQNPPFPYQSTGDQFFDEAQFESYRQLGLHVADTVLREAQERESTEIGSFNPEAFFGVLREAWRGRRPVDATLSTAHHERLDALYERLRSDPELDFLSAEFFPEWPQLTGRAPTATALPADPAQRKSGFYLCREIAQLMEQVYQDLDLENQYDHPDCRGWINLFRHWSWSPMFRATYAITAATLDERFQRFCDRRLQLDLGDVELVSAPVSAQSLAQLNVVERGLVSKDVATRDLADLTLVRFELVIPYPADASAELLRFHFGFALLDGTRLLGFRVQDHLRRSGLARRAMTRLLAENPGIDARSATSSADQTVIVRLCASVNATRASAADKVGERWQDE
ncbi:MAG: hypothetical protein H6R17_2569 [Proteobacteria bacterium]|nr:hypothetical protein [Pseudomonadota bacterium]